MSDVEIYKRVQRTTTGKRVVTWIWVVKCDGEIIASGPENTKRDAKKMGNRAAEDLCISTSQSSHGEYEGEDGKIYNVEILPPAINASIVNGHLDSVEFVDPWTDEYSSFTSNEISENELSWILGLCFYDEILSQEYELVAAQLKVWGIYLGGNSIDEIKSLHNLSDENFNAIVTKTWDSIIINKTEDDNGEIHLDWDISIT